MTKNEVDFDTYFGNIQMHVLDRVGVETLDEAKIRKDYDAGRDMFDVTDEICAEYGEDNKDDE